MWRLIFAVTMCVSAAATPASSAAQHVPGRDLLEFPLATVAEPPVLASLGGDGTWNPAVVRLEDGVRFRATVAALDGPVETGVTAQLVALALPIGSGFTGAFSLIRAYVVDLPRTEGDPQTLPGDIRYGSTLLSATLARSLTSSLNAGIALRQRVGELDRDSKATLGMDVGLVATDVGPLNSRLAASTFLWKPGGSDEARYSVAGDARMLGGAADSEVRLGYGFSFGNTLATEHYFSVSAHLLALEVNAGALNTLQHGHAGWRNRVGVAMRFASYQVGLSRDENGGSLGAIYQIVLSACARK